MMQKGFCSSFGLYAIIMLVFLLIVAMVYRDRSATTIEHPTVDSGRIMLIHKLIIRYGLVVVYPSFPANSLC